MFTGKWHWPDLFWYLENDFKQYQEKTIHVTLQHKIICYKYWFVIKKKSTMCYFIGWF